MGWMGLTDEELGRRMFGNMDELWEVWKSEMRGTEMPAYDVLEDRVLVEMPGVAREDVTVAQDATTLLVRWKDRREAKRELRVALREGERATASALRDGLLTVSLTRETKKSVTIPVD